MPAPFEAVLLVDRYLRGVRIDSFLLRHFRNYTPFRIQRMIRAGCVRIDDVRAELVERVYPGQHVRVRLVEPPDKLLAPSVRPLELLYEDEFLLVANKPPGQIAHPVGESLPTTLANAVQSHLDRQTPFPGLLRPGIVHRLDRETSGAIVVPKDHLTHRLLSIDFQRQRVAKEYLALVEGTVRDDSGTIDLPIGESLETPLLMSCRAEARAARPARTRYEVVARFARHTLVRALPRTGRLHQIRVHFATLGHPIVGDEFYGPFGVIARKPDRAARADDAFAASHDSPGGRDANDERGADVEDEDLDAVEDGDVAAATPAFRFTLPDRPDVGIARHALHAARLAFAHPVLGTWSTFEAPLPDDMQGLIDALAAPADPPVPAPLPATP